VLAEGRYLRLVRDEGWEFVERMNATGVVTIVAVTDANELLLTEQFRKPVAARVIDLPSGLAGDTKRAGTESLPDAARRELSEETGFAAGRLKRLTSVPTSPGLTSEVVTFFRAFGLRPDPTSKQAEGEEITVHHVRLTSIAAWLRKRARSGVEIDPKVYAALYFVGFEPRR
jgi:ADP-ribose pyrophosphatase